MTPTHHPPLELLLDYAAGAIDPAAALIVQCHGAMCADCRAAIATFEAAGGALLDQLPPAALAPDGLSAMLARLDREGPPDRPEIAAPADPVIASLPGPLQPLAGQTLGRRPWRSLIAGVRALDLDLPGRAAGAVQILEIPAGRGVPRHGHGGRELSLVLSGAYADAGGRYGAGDLQIAGPGDTHRPIAESGDICRVLAVTDSAPRLTGLLGIAQKILGNFR